MQRTLPLIVACTLLAAPFFGSASPAPGCADLTPPGFWSNMQADASGVPDCLQRFDGLTYVIWGMCPSREWADSTGQWDLIREYSGGGVTLANVPGTFWYSSSDTNQSFEIALPPLLVKLRSPGDLSTNLGSAYLEMELGAHAGCFVFLATYAGTPSVTHVPESPESFGYTEVTAPLSWARFCIGSAIQNSGVPLSIRGMLTGSSKVELSWSSSTNRLYQLQRCSDLAGDLWTDLGIPMVGTGTPNRAVDAVEPGAAQRFYRILEFP